MAVRKYREKPREPSEFYAAQYTGSESVNDLRDVASEHDSDAAVAEVPEFRVLLVRTKDDRGGDNWNVVPKGGWLVFSPRYFVLYSVESQAELERRYEIIDPREKSR